MYYCECVLLCGFAFALDMITNVDHKNLSNNGYHMTKNVGLHMAVNVDTRMTTHVCLDMTTNAGMCRTASVDQPISTNWGPMYSYVRFPESHENLKVLDFPQSFPMCRFYRAS